MTEMIRRRWSLVVFVAIGLGVVFLVYIKMPSPLEALPDYAQHKARFDGALKDSADARSRQDWDVMWREQIKADHEGLCYWNQRNEKCSDWRKEHVGND